MKTIMLALLVVSFALGGCATTFHSAGESDGIYYTPRATRHAGGTQQSELPRASRDELTEPQAEYRETIDDQQYQYQEYTEYQYSEPQAYQEDEYQSRDWYYSESQYDFSYAARIRRFHRPNYHWAYFDPWFTNMFWYTHNPMYFGVSIYSGFGALSFYYPGFMFWNPAFYWYSWVTPFHWYSPMHFWSNHWAWNRWTPWWGHHWGVHSWSHAYWSGFHAGFQHGWWSNPFNYQYIYNSHDRSNYFYGHRGATGTIVGSVANRREDRELTFAERFEARGRTETPTTRDPNLNVGNRGVRGTNDDGRVLPGQAAAPGTERGRERIPETGQTPREVRDRTGEGNISGPREQPGRLQTPERSTPADRQVRGERDGNIHREPVGRTPERTGPETRPAVPQRQPETRPSPAPAQRQPETRPTPAPVQRQPETRPDVPQREPEARPVRPERTPEDFRAPSRSQYERQAIERFERQAQPQREVQPQGSNPEPNRPRTYTPPSYQRPTSNQEYTRPQTSRPQGAPRPESINRPESRPGSQPERTPTMPRPTQQTRPSGQERSQPSFTPPSRPQSSPRSAPQRTAPAPQRQPSGGSMSTPPPSRGSSGSSGSSSERGRP